MLSMLWVPESMGLRLAEYVGSGCADIIKVLINGEQFKKMKGDESYCLISLNVTILYFVP
jgi:hypothetical protein